MFKFIYLLLILTIFAGHHKKNEKRKESFKNEKRKESFKNEKRKESFKNEKRKESFKSGTFSIKMNTADTNRRLAQSVYKKWKTRFTKFTLKEFSWTINIPKSYNPNEPAGILYYISNSTSGKLPSKDWQKILEKKNLIYISSNDLSYISPQEIIHFSVLQGVEKIKTMYSINPKRIYVTGIGRLESESSGAQHATSTAILSSDLFKGAIYINGASTWEKLQIPKKLNTYWPSFFGSLDKDKRVTGLSKAKLNAYVFIYESNDYINTIFKNYKKKGLRKIKWLESSDYGSQNMNIAIDFLDNPKKQ